MDQYLENLPTYLILYATLSFPIVLKIENAVF